MSKKKKKGGRGSYTRVGSMPDGVDDAPEAQPKPRQSGSDPTPTKKGVFAVKGGPASPGTKNPSRRCRTIKKNGEQCKAAPIKGGFTCRQHGGSLPNVKRAAAARLLELVDPSLAALHKVLTNPDTDDPVKVRAAVAILDRTGFGPGSTVHVSATKWDAMTDDLAQNGFIEVDRSLDGGGGDTPALMANLEQHALDLSTDNWRPVREEDAPVRIYADENTIPGEVIDPDPHPQDEEAWREAGREPRRDPAPTTRRVRRDG